MSQISSPLQRNTCLETQCDTTSLLRDGTQSEAAFESDSSTNLLMEPPQVRPARSKNGCAACKRRKVRCNERRPRCGHCERLNLECTWDRPANSRGDTPASLPQASNTPLRTGTTPLGPRSPSASLFGFDRSLYFDPSNSMASSTWDEAMLLSPSSWPLDDTLPDFHRQLITAPPTHLAADDSNRIVGQISDMESHQERNATQPASTSPFSNESSIVRIDQDNHLVETFLQMFMPPILVPVEVGPKWASTRAFFASMAHESALVRDAIMAFAAMQLQENGMQNTGTMTAEWQPLYETAHRQLSAMLSKRASSSSAQKPALKYLLASLFLLTYTDLLTKTLPRAHANLRDAYELVHRSDSTGFTTHERRLISWLRLLDGRAVSTAGGEGLFLADMDETLFDASPMAESTAEPSQLDSNIEEILFDVLYHPGIVFYQKVQSFVGRITKIDPWHRSRGTVQDETEVMAIGEQISNDLNALYGQRPALMDHCVAGNLTERHLAKDLAAALTRSFRTYLANYYASFIHLHRVAYVQYPKTKALISAIGNVKKLSHSMAEVDEALPVNLLWPLMMWGCEEEDFEERQWILHSIRSLENIATNAKVTADLLEEVQRRQDQAKKRIDVRSVSHECFASYHFAIV